jgi:glycosyltransferase involved in cell wall biosynthesis
VRLNGFDVVVIQHEYGIFGGADGQDVLDVVRAVTRPIIVVLHTVLTTPSVNQRAIIEELVLLSHTVVTMTQTAKDRLVSGYATAPDKVRVIPHGATDIRLEGRVDDRDEDPAPVVLTWGLLGEGKGIEWGISAMAQLRDIHPAPTYHIVGRTHPKVLERDGEAYRHGLQTRARDLGVDDAVAFDARYLETTALSRLVHEADVVLLPYDSRDQVTSGVLVEAVTAGKPVVSTSFPHAVELLSSGAGLLVERQDPDAIAAALRRVLTEPGLADSLSAEANRLSPQLLWGAVAQQYRDLASSALRDELVRASA